MASLLLGLPGWYFGALLGASCIAIFGVVRLLRELYIREFPRRRVVVTSSMIMIPFPLYVTIGYINVPIFLGPICIVLALFIGHNRYTKGHLDKRKVDNAIQMLIGGMLLSTFGLAVSGLKMYVTIQALPVPNIIKIMPVFGALFLSPLIHGLVARILIKRWR